ncbi:CHAT domain-containing tetratricopeptide repeat protein [Halocola ammonii]
MKIFRLLLFTYLFATCSLGFGQLSEFEEKIYPDQLQEDPDFKEARELGALSSSEAIPAFEQLLKKYSLKDQPKAHLAIQYLKGASIHPYGQQQALEVYLLALEHSEEFPELHSRLLTRKAWAMGQLAHPKAVEAGEEAYSFTTENQFPAAEQLNAITHYFAALHRSGQLQKCHEILSDYKRLVKECEAADVKHTALSQLGRFYFEMGIHDQAARYVEEDLKMCREAFGDTSLMTTNAYITVGIVASQIGDHEKEIQYYEKAAEMLDFLISEKQYHHYSVYINLGHAYSNIGNYSLAYDYYLKSKSILDRLTPEKDPERSDVYSSLTIYHARNGNADSVMFYSEKVKEIFSGVDHALKLQAFYKIGDAMYMIDRQERALEIHNELIAMIDEKFDGKHLYKSKALLFMAEDESDTKAKLELLNEALAALHPEFDYSADMDVPPNAAFLDNSVAKDLLLAKSKVLAEEASSQEDLEYVLKHVNLGMEVLDAIYEEQLTAAAIRTSKSAREFYALGLQTLEKLYKESGNRQHLASAYSMVQKSKGHLLGQFLVEKEMLASADDTLRTEIDQLQEEQYLIRQQLSMASDESQLQARLAEIDQQLTELKDQLRSTNPEYYEFIHQPGSLSLEEAQKYFRSRKSTGVEYFVESERIFAIVISGNDAVLVSWSVDGQTAERAQKLLSEMQQMTAEEYQEDSHLLYSAVFEPLESEINGKSVVVVPDSWIAHIPLEILVRDKLEENPHFNQLSYLIKDYNFSYLYSSDMLAPTLSKKSERKNRQLYLGVAPGFAGDENQIAQVYRGNSSQPALLGAQKEVESAAEIFSQKVRRSDKDLEGLIKNEGNNYDILHLATHADIDEKSPLNSKIYLGDGTTESRDDGILHQYELFSMNLDNELTVLSACKTGSGPWIEGEGVNSLARGFIYSGSNSIVLSYWDVHDQTSSRLMKSFFQNLNNGKGRSESLRNAKLKYLQEADAVQANPYYWAGFVLFGETMPLQSVDSTDDFWLYMIPILILVIFAVGFRIARKKYRERKEE